MDLTRRMFIRWRRLTFLLILLLISAYYVYLILRSGTMAIFPLRGHNENHMGDDSVRTGSPGLSDEGFVLSVSQNTNSDVHVIIPFTKATNNTNLQRKFNMTMTSLLRFSTRPVHLYIGGDEGSLPISANILAGINTPSKYKVVFFNIGRINRDAKKAISDLQTKLNVNRGSYYSDDLFFLSTVLHRVFPQLDRAIMLDCDLKINADINDLNKYFDEFTATTVMAMAFETQPTYRAFFGSFRSRNKDTKIGDPPPDGLTGFNSGVLLMDLKKMRTSHLYNSIANADALNYYMQKYSFEIHLGDQDLYTLMWLNHPELFYVLPCNWNRQLCLWFRDHGYKSVFDKYFRCEGRIHIYHGNCNTDIPHLDWERGLV